MEWIRIEDELPKHGKRSFLACWKNQGCLMLVCFVDIHLNYIIAGSNMETCGNGNNPRFSHWSYLPEPPKLWWDCKYCGENEDPKCHKCVREDGLNVSDELCDD